MIKKKIRYSKTIWFSIALVVFGAVMDNFSSIQNVLPENWYGISYIIIGVVVAILRFVTSKPI
jgi:hypothetical protein